ncbi:MAG TPA: aldehyde dehydrogenase [Spirochaeta sp.]|nr:aldehyde dehydrogenase [Spirochaeta sp.]
MRGTERTIDLLLEKARKAQEQIAGYTQEQIDEVCIAVGWQVYDDDNIKQLAEAAVTETGMGNVEDKIKKHKGKVLGVLKDVISPEAKSVGLIEEDEAKGLKKYAKPVGVVGALTPVTNPTATPSSNSISIIKGRNAVIFAPHPKAKNCSKMAVDFMRQGLKKVGAPEDLIQIIEEPSIALSNALMAEVDLVLATGGGAMVKAAYSSGTPSFGVGPGNSIQIIAEDADVKDACAKVALSKAFDNATSCSSENGIIVHESIYDDVIRELAAEGSHLCSAEEKKTLQNWMWVENKNGHIALNPSIVAKSAQDIAADAGLTVSSNVRILAVEAQSPVCDEKYADEKLSPVIAVWKYSTFDEGLQLLKDITDHAGTGHSCGIHTSNEKYIERLGLEMKSSRIMVNQPQAPANGGNFFNGMPSTVTLGCGTWGGNVTTENINYKHFLNVTWLSKLIPVVKPTDEQMFGGYWKKHGK